MRSLSICQIATPFKSDLDIHNISAHAKRRNDLLTLREAELRPGSSSEAILFFCLMLSITNYPFLVLVWLDLALSGIA